MQRNKLRRGARGQGMVEYALILVLGAVAVIVATFAIGLAVQRLYGVVVGALGTKASVTNASHATITIAEAKCYLAPNHVNPDSSKGVVAMWVTGYYSSGLSVSDLTASTNYSVGTGVNNMVALVKPNGANSFLWNPDLKFATTDSKYCPIAVVIQSKDGVLAASPVMVCTDDGVTTSC
jgi:Flp pilus assembly pilin Flp